MGRRASGSRDCRRCPEPGAAAGIGYRTGGDRSRDPAPDRQSVRLPRARRNRYERGHRTDARLAGAGGEYRRKPVRGVARIGAGLRQIGRDEEIELLLRWARQIGTDRSCWFPANPTGKSRLTAALEERLHAEPRISACAISLLALSPGQPALSASTNSAMRRVCPRRSACDTAGEARGLARLAPPPDAGTPRSDVIAGFGAPSAAEPQPAAQEGADLGGADLLSSKVWRAGSPWSWSLRMQ